MNLRHVFVCNTHNYVLNSSLIIGHNQNRREMWLDPDEVCTLLPTRDEDHAPCTQTAKQVTDCHRGVQMAHAMETV